MGSSSIVALHVQSKLLYEAGGMASLNDILYKYLASPNNITISLIVIGQL
jgi:hypothetical protein